MRANDNQIDSLQQLKENNYSIVYDSPVKTRINFFNKMDPALFTEIQHAFLYSINKPKTTLYTSEELFYYNLNDLCKNELPEYKQFSTHEDSNNYHGLVLLYDYPLQKRMDILLQRLNHAGITEKIFKDVVNPSRHVMMKLFQMFATSKSFPVAIPETCRRVQRGHDIIKPALQQKQQDKIIFLKRCTQWRKQVYSGSQRARAHLKEQYKINITYQRSKNVNASCRLHLPDLPNLPLLSYSPSQLLPSLYGQSIPSNSHFRNWVISLATFRERLPIIFAQNFAFCSKIIHSSKAQDIGSIEAVYEQQPDVDTSNLDLGSHTVINTFRTEPVHSEAPGFNVLTATSLHSLYRRTSTESGGGGTGGG
ncbi:hypothetical protein C0J52_18847 [Blattella germanica]|nr:hypothetical protein C0J52_18847 [Blattella germanica]